MASSRSPSPTCSTTLLVVSGLVGFAVGWVFIAIVGNIVFVFVDPQGFLDWLMPTLIGVWILTGAGAGVGFARLTQAMRRARYQKRRTSALCERRCPECDYDLRGTIEPRCPECGEAFTAQEWKLTAGSVNDPS